MFRIVIPIGHHPFKPGTTVVADGRPWWGFGVCEIAPSGRFRIRFARNYGTHTPQPWDDPTVLGLRERREGEPEPSPDVPLSHLPSRSPDGLQNRSRDS